MDSSGFYILTKNKKKKHTKSATYEQTLISLIQFLEGKI
jgi:hypothetical protein